MGWTFITQQGELEGLLPRLMEKPAWGFDTETTGLDPHKDKVILAQIGRPEEQFLIDTRKVSLEPLRPFFESPLHKKIGHNLKFDYKMMKGSLGIEVETLRCTFLAERILNVGRKMSGFNLKACLENRLGIAIDKEQQKSFIGHTGDFTHDQLEYAATDTAYLLPLSQSQCADLLEDGLQYTWILECDAIPCFGDMELAGAILNKEHWQNVIRGNEKALEETRVKMNAHARNWLPTNLFDDVDINYSSPKQILELFQKMRITIKSTDYKTGAQVSIPVTDTNDKTLKKIKGYPFIDLLKQYRHYHIRINTFGYPFLEAIHPVTGKIHPEFDQIGTETGRPASHRHSPVNMLNIPRDAKYRNGFVAQENYVVETDDYSGCELRILAEISRDPGLCEAFQKGIDVHCYVASRLFRVEVTKDNENKHLRTPAKPLNFGIAYGMGPFSVYETLNGQDYEITLDETRELYRKYCEEEFRVAVDYLRESGKLAAAQGWLSNLNGRRRYWLLPDPSDRERYPNGRYDRRYKGRIASIEREGGNMRIQSVNADMTKLAMAKIRKYKKDNKIRTEFMNQVYDEIVTVTHKDDTESFHPVKQKLMIEAAEQWLKNVPMEVDGHVGPCWTK